MTSKAIVCWLQELKGWENVTGGGQPVTPSIEPSSEVRGSGSDKKTSSLPDRRRTSSLACSSIASDSRWGQLPLSRWLDAAVLLGRR